MLTTCPKCKTKFSFLEDAVSDGDMVQCSVCDTEWEYTPSTIVHGKMPDIGTYATPPSKEIAVDKLKTLATKRASPKAPKDSKVEQTSKEIKNISRRGWGSAIATVIVIVMFALLFIVFKPQITKHFPLSQSIYSGYSRMVKYISQGGIIFSETDINTRVQATVVKAVLSNVGGKRILTIRGVVKNISSNKIKGVGLTTNLRNSKGEVIKVITFRLGTHLKVGQAEVFKISVPEPPVNAIDIEITVSK